MFDLKWTESEKKVARRVFESALNHELGEIQTKFKEKVVRLVTADEMWAMEAWLSKHRREIERKYDFRYSQLIIVFGTLLREGRITEQNLSKLAEEKIEYILRVASL